MKDAVYTTLMGKRLNLNELIKKQKACLEKVFDLYQKNRHTAEVFNEIAVVIDVPRAIGPSPVFNQVLWDLWDRLAIRQGYLRKGENSDTDFTENEKVLKKFLNRQS